MTNLKEALYYLEVGLNHRKKASGSETVGSKSHFLVNLTIVQENLITKINKSGSMSFVDLVGCERNTNSTTIFSGDELQENKSINRGLSQLHLCIENVAKGLKGDFRSCSLTK